MIRAALLWLYGFGAPLTGDSARVEAGRLIVEPIGISFRIPPAWLATTVDRLGSAGCDRHSASARTVNTDPASLRSMTGPSTYFGDQYYSAMSDSVFQVSELIAHVGSRGWRECDNSEDDLQVRVYVTSRTPEELAQRLRSVQMSPYPGYSRPVVAAPQDSGGWRIERADWEYNCGDCIFAQRLEIYSRRIHNRTVSLVFMYSPTTGELYSTAQADRRAILSSLTLARSPGASVSIISPECYALTYSDPVKDAAPRLFPIWIELFPGSDSGSVGGQPHRDFDPREWPAMNSNRWWKRLPSDSVEVNFSGNYEAIQLHFRRSGPAINGRAIFLSDLVENGPLPSMRFIGTRKPC